MKTKRDKILMNFSLSNSVSLKNFLDHKKNMKKREKNSYESKSKNKR